MGPQTIDDGAGTSTNAPPLDTSMQNVHQLLSSAEQASSPDTALQSPVSASAVTLQSDIIQEEAAQLAPILKEMVSGRPDTRADIYSPTYQCVDRAVFVLRASELLLEQALQISILSELVEYTALRVKATADAQPLVRQSLTKHQILEMLDTFPDDMDGGQMVYEIIRKVERHHGVGAP